MSGYIPSPTPPGKLGWQGQTPLLVPNAGLSIVPGVGILGRTNLTGSQLLIDSQRADAMETINLFVPGLLSAMTVATLRNSRVAMFPQQASVAILEANLLTAPGPSVNATNYLGLVFSGSGANGIAGGSQTLPLLTSRNVTDTNGDANIASITGYSGGSTGTNTSNGTANDGHRGFAFPLQVTGNTFVTGLAFSMPGSTLLQNMPLYVQLLDSNWNEIVGANCTMPAAVANFGGMPRVQFATSVELLQGQTYYLGVTSKNANSPQVTINDGSLPTYTGNLSLPATAVYGVPNGGTIGNWSDRSIYLAPGWRPWPTLYGAPSQVLLTGQDLTVALVVTGAPSASDLGQNLNIRLTLAA